MAYFLVVQNDVVINAIVAEPPFFFENGQGGLEYIEYFKQVGEPGIGWTRDQQGNFIPPQVGE